MKPVGNRFLLILSGPPGTGKTYLAHQIIKQDNEWSVLSYDDIKEDYFDRFGFNNLTEKEQRGNDAWESYYKKLETLMNKGQKIIIDYPFSYKQEKTLKKMIHKNDYTPITITLFGDINVLYNRQKERDLSDNRHIGHILTTYHIEETRHIPDDIDTFQTFKNRCEDRKYDEFYIGEYKKVDVTQFENVDIQGIVEWVKKKVKTN